MFSWKRERAVAEGGTADILGLSEKPECPSSTQIVRALSPNYSRIGNLYSRRCRHFFIIFYSFVTPFSLSSFIYFFFHIPLPATTPFSHKICDRIILLLYTLLFIDMFDFITIITNSIVPLPLLIGILLLIITFFFLNVTIKIIIIISL